MMACGMLTLFLLIFCCQIGQHSVLSLNITELVFGENTTYLPAAFGDFNSDKLTDMFVVTRDGKTLKLLISNAESPLFREPNSPEGPSCTYKTLNIVSVVPGDFDGNGAMDVMIISLGSGTPLYDVHILWGSLRNMTLECGDENSPLLKLSGQPLVMDMNGDMIPDLFGEDENGTRKFWVFSTERKPPTPRLLNYDKNETYPRLKIPSSHAFVDLNSDLAADLWITAKTRFEIWTTTEGMYQLSEIIDLPPDVGYVGQTSFADVNLDGNIDAVVPVCFDKNILWCKKNSIFIYDFVRKEWIQLDVSFEDPTGNLWSFATSSQGDLYTETTTLRVGDCNLDGYPDLLVTLFDQSRTPRVVLLENVKCKGDSCKYHRSFAIKWNLFKEFGSTVMGTFFDFQEDGTLDVLLVQKTATNEYQLGVYKDATEYDAVFVKVLIPTGRCYGEDCALNNIAYGTNQPGPSITYSITTADGSNQCSKATQLHQSAHHSLQLPYTVFGLGRNWNFVEVMKVGIPRGNNSVTLTSSFTQIIPNSQLIVIPYPMENPDRWELTMSPEDGAPGVMFSRFFIPPPAQPNPYLETEIIVKHILEDMDRKTAHSLMLDGYITPGERAWNELDPRMIRNTSPAMPGGDPSHRGYWKGSWSPYGVGVNGRCLLTLVTYDHRVTIMGREGHKWITVVDISALWYKEVAKDSWKMVALPLGAALHEIHTARMHMLGVSEIQWIPIFQEGNKRFCILMMITISGHVVFWKIPVELTNAEEVQLLSIEETKMKMTSAIHWFSDEKSGYLAVGCSSGQVKVFYVQFAEEFLFRDLGYAFSSDDRVRVNHLQFLYLEDKSHMLLLGKQSFLVVVTLNLSENDLNTKNIAHSQLGRLPISGMICLKNRNVFLSMKDGNIQHVYIDYDKEGMKIELKETPFKTEGVSYTGLVASPNGSLWAILESVSVAYDHLVVREPSQISIYQVGSGEKIFQYLQDRRVPLHFNAVLLESLRLYYCKTGKTSMQLMTPEKIDSHTESQVKLHYWLAKMCRSIRVTNENNSYPLEAIEAALECHIIEVWITATIKKFITEDLSSKSSLFLSLSLMCQWITANGKKDKTIASKLAKKLTGPKTEQCPICTEIVPLKLLTSGTCEKGHTLPRCCRTLLVTKPIIMCSRCKSFTHNLAVEVQMEGIATCLFCEGRMTHLTRRRT